MFAFALPYLMLSVPELFIVFFALTFLLPSPRDYERCWGIASFNEVFCSLHEKSGFNRDEGWWSLTYLFHSA